MKQPVSIPYLDWELLGEPLELRPYVGRATLLESPFLPGQVRSITVLRRDDYRVQARVSTIRPYIDMWQPPLVVEGGAVQPFSVSFTHEDGNTYSFEGCSYREFSWTEDYAPDGTSFRRTTIVLDVYEFRVDYFGDGTPVVVTDWFLNAGSPGELWDIFPDWSEHTTVLEHGRRRRGRGRRVQRIPGSIRIPLPQRDHAYVPFDGRAFVVQAVPNDLGPAWSKCIGLEYRSEWGGIPDLEERRAYAEIVGFVLGRRLLGVGTSEFTAQSDLVSRRAIAPDVLSPQATCSLPSMPPVQLRRHTGTDIVSELGSILKRLTPVYLAHREEFRLSLAFFRYMVTRETPLGSDLPLMHSAIETAKAGYFQPPRKVKAVYMEKDKFESSFADPLKQVANALGRRAVKRLLRRPEYADRILRKIRGSFEMTSNEALDLFFESLRLPIGEIERRAIRERNSAAHGGGTHSAEEARLLDLYRRAYYTLANRVFLKLLDYRGQYIDYTANPLVTRPLADVPLGVTQPPSPDGEQGS